MSTELLDAVDDRFRNDKKILKIFGVIVAVLFTIVLIALIASKVPAQDALVNAVTAGVGVGVYVCGTMEFIRIRKISRISRRGMLRLLTATSLTLWLILIAVVAWILLPGDVDIGLPLEMDSSTIVIVLIGLLFASVLSIVLMAILAFGAVGLMTAITRMLTPEILVRVRSISERKTRTDWALAWIFGIPDTLDTRTLTVNVPVADVKFPRKMFTQAVGWELFLGTILAIYVAFNPLVVTPDSIGSLFGILGTVSLFVPLVIVPWFVYTSVDATIRGMTKDFRLYDGIKARIFRSYVAVGTMVVFIRISLSETQIQIYLFGFAGYLTGLVMVALLFTFIYFNFFDRELTKDIVVRYNQLVT